MKLRQGVRAMFVENKRLKAVSFLLAVTLFVVVRGERQAQAVIDLPVIYDATPGRILAAEAPATVRLVVKGPWARLHRLARQLDPLHVDLSQVEGGELPLRAEMVHLPPGLQVAAFSPPALRLKVEARLMRALPVFAILDGSPAYGYRADIGGVSPRTLRVSGPQSVVAGLSRVETSPVLVDGASAPFERRVGLAPLPPRVEPVDASGASRVVVRVAVTPELVQRTIATVPIAVEGPGAASARIDPPHVSIVLHGERLRVDGVSAATLGAVVDVARLGRLGAGPHAAPVEVRGLPEGVAALAKPATVAVTFER